MNPLNETLAADPGTEIATGALSLLVTLSEVPRTLEHNAGKNGSPNSRISRTRREFVVACHAKHFDACFWLPSGDAWEVGWDNGLIGFDLRDHHIDAIGPA